MIQLKQLDRMTLLRSTYWDDALAAQGGNASHRDP